MARSTVNPSVEIPKGMHKFEVIRTTIRDSLGQYCVPGDMAVLDRDSAQAYLDKNLIKVQLPDFDAEESNGEDASDTANADGEDETQRTEVESYPRPRARQRAKRAAANSE